MSIETFLEKQLQKFSIIDISLVKFVYFFLSLMIFSLYPKLSELDWWFYLTLTVVCVLPLWIFLFSQPGGLFEKMRLYLTSNTPSKQVLLFLSVFFFALMLGVLLPVLVSFTWWYYVFISLLLAIKPLTVSRFW